MKKDYAQWAVNLHRAVHGSNEGCERYQNMNDTELQKHIHNMQLQIK